jgi:hypothetical protein
VANKTPSMPDFVEPHSIVFLDLEETVIDDWENGDLLLENIEKIAVFLNGKDITWKGQPDNYTSTATPLLNMRLGLMSWAVWDDVDKGKFNKRFRPHLEALLNRKFDDELVWSMNDWCAQLFKHSHLLLSKNDVFDIFGKEQFLFKFCQVHPLFKDNTVFLIDDVVEHQLTCKSFINRCTTQTCNIKKM